MLSFHVKFVHADGRTDRRTTVKQYAPNLLIKIVRIHANSMYLDRNVC